MPAQRFLALVSGKLKQIAASVTGTADAIPAGDSTGRLDISWMPVGVGAEVVVCTTSENLSQGNWVNLYLNGGVITARRADATTSSKQCHGFVLASSTSGNNATVYMLSNTNTQESGLTIGSDYYLSTTPGQITSTPPSSAGNIVQYIGRALTTTNIVFESSMPVEVA